MGNPYCGKHEWSANHPSGPCPDCAEVAALTSKLESATRCNCPGPCNAQGCLLKEIERLRGGIDKFGLTVVQLGNKLRAAELQNGLLREYIVFLGDELSETVPMAAIHGWRSTRFERGVEMRKKLGLGEFAEKRNCERCGGSGKELRGGVRVNCEVCRP